MEDQKNKSQYIQLGFVKDAIAFPMFFAGIVIILITSDLNIFRETMIVLLTIAMFIDGTFTLQPSLHCSPFGLNESTFFTLSIFAIGLIFIIAACFYHFYVQT